MPRPVLDLSPRQRLLLWVALSYVTLQVALPLRQFVVPAFDSPRNFTWNMFAVYWSCNGGYQLTTPEGETRELPYLEAFHRPWGAGRVTYRDRLPEFHEWMCESLEDAGELGVLEGRIACRVNDGPAQELVAHGVDLCTAPNHGVL